MASIQIAGPGSRPRRRRGGQGPHPVVVGSVGSVVILLVWWAVASVFFTGPGALPTPLEVLLQFPADGLGFYWTNLQVTLVEAAQGYLLGAVLALLLAVLVLLVPSLERAGTQLAVVTYCLPPVAVAPVVFLLLGAPSPGDPSRTATCLAALLVFFLVYTNAVLGFRSADRQSLELVQAYGGRRRHQLLKVQLPASVPALIGGLKIAAPIAVLGAILGEYAGGVDKGLGPALLTAQRQVDAPRTFAIGLLSAAVAGGWFALLALVERLARLRLGGGGAELSRGPVAGGRGGGPWLAVVLGAGALAFLLLLWWLGLLAIDASPFVSKTPGDVWRYLFVDEAAAGNREIVLGNIAVTLADAGLGFVAGLIVAFALAVAMTLIPSLSHVVLPWALVIQLVPLVAMAPVIILLFGRGTATVAVLGGLIVFFPGLVNISMGLRTPPQEMLELVAVYGGGRPAQLRKVRLAACVPALFAAIKIGVPAAINGALLAEWLATGRGVGGNITTAMSSGNNIAVWAHVVVMTGVALGLYALVVVLEKAVLRRQFT
ncbi:ABC transporter permease [Pseudactinotalea sp. HY158]|uniref:ABC transporter permease n=1 Tax=Pseudactinotalea sp. HY158 TaxID=2654547 RepID=UPI00129D0046|nr:ABC transporter permease subunit [Pseudactinotalea sp. HY158]QGH70296.1 ABC transporter permease subunit [Pseudactinotalea sp. HY158]